MDALLFFGPVLFISGVAIGYIYGSQGTLHNYHSELAELDRRRAVVIREIARLTSIGERREDQ